MDVPEHEHDKDKVYSMIVPGFSGSRAEHGNRLTIHKAPPWRGERDLVKNVILLT